LGIALGCVFATGACVPEPGAGVDVEEGPPIAFEEEPGLVEIEPGIEVVPDLGSEVFFIDGWYWHHWHGHWFHASDWHGGWVPAAPPPRLLGLPGGHYRYWHDGRMTRPGPSIVIHQPRPRYPPPRHAELPPPRPVQLVVSPPSHAPVHTHTVAPPPARSPVVPVHHVAPPPAPRPAEHHHP
jgi:hypothetical protein